MKKNWKESTVYLIINDIEKEYNCKFKIHHPCWISDVKRKQGYIMKSGNGIKKYKCPKEHYDDIAEMLHKLEIKYPKFLKK